MSEGTRVTATEIETDESRTVIIQDDYNLIADGSCYVDHVTVYGNGTHVITVRGVKQRVVSDD